MTAEEVLDTVAGMEAEDWLKIQAGIAKLLAARLSPDDAAEIAEALAEAEAEFARGEGIGSAEMRRHFGVTFGNRALPKPKSCS